jgi:NAD-dependent dihydropyrimidine dehydrogenase PreA subunit
MKCLILLHSATGNTRLMARYAESRIRRAGHECTIHDITARPRPPVLGKVDLLGVACPTMYFRPTFAMERFVARMPESKTPKPAFLLATAGGEPGAHFSLLAEQLSHKNYIVMGAHWVVFPESWPPHLALVKGLAGRANYGRNLCERFPSFRPWLGIAWPEVGVPQQKDRDALERFLVKRLEKTPGFRPEEAPPFQALHRSMPGFNLMGRMVTSEIAREYTAVKVIPERCSRCGICVKVCPAGCITQGTGEVLPVFGSGCTGCWACFQHCPDRAISGWKVVPGQGRYPGPSRELRRLFKPDPA